MLPGAHSAGLASREARTEEATPPGPRRGCPGTSWRPTRLRLASPPTRARYPRSTRCSSEPQVKPGRCVLKWPVGCTHSLGEAEARLVEDSKKASSEPEIPRALGKPVFPHPFPAVPQTSTALRLRGYRQGEVALTGQRQGPDSPAWYPRPVLLPTVGQRLLQTQRTPSCPPAQSPSCPASERGRAHRGGLGGKPQPWEQRREQQTPRPAHLKGPLREPPGLSLCETRVDFGDKEGSKETAVELSGVGSGLWGQRKEGQKGPSTNSR